MRYQSFKDGAELAAALRDRAPSKIDIGPAYTHDPGRRAAYQGGRAGWGGELAATWLGGSCEGRKGGWRLPGLRLHPLVAP